MERHFPHARWTILCRILHLFALEAMSDQIAGDISMIFPLLVGKLWRFIHHKPVVSPTFGPSHFKLEPLEPRKICPSRPLRLAG